MEIDGFTHVHRFELVPGPDGYCSVRYTSRRQVDPLVDHVRKTGKLDFITFGQKRDPCTSIFGKLKTSFVPPSQAPELLNVGVTISTNTSGIKPTVDSTGQPRKTLVLRTDASPLKELDLDTLEPLGVTEQKQLHPDLKGPLSCAHAQYDHATGDIYNYNLELGLTPTYRVFRTSSKTGETEILAKISDRTLPAAYMHSFFLTEDFVILALWSAHYAAGGASVLWQRNLLDAISPFDKTKGVKWLVVDRHHGKGVVARFESPATVSFHTVNAWQERQSKDSNTLDIYCDVIQYPTLDILHRFYYENLVSTGPGAPKYADEDLRSKVTSSFTRYRLTRIPSDASKVQKQEGVQEAEVILQLPTPLVGDLPIINPSYSTKKSRFVYSVVDRGYSSWVDGISKLDTETKEAKYWMQERHTPGEPIFVPDHETEEEDAGYILTVVLDGDKGTSYLLCLDAKTMTEVGRAECDVPVGMGFHGSFVPKI